MDIAMQILQPHQRSLLSLVTALLTVAFSTPAKAAPNDWETPPDHTPVRPLWEGLPRKAFLGFEAGLQFRGESSNQLGNRRPTLGVVVGVPVVKAPGALLTLDLRANSRPAKYICDECTGRGLGASVGASLYPRPLAGLFLGAAVGFESSWYDRGTTSTPGHRDPFCQSSGPLGDTCLTVPGASYDDSFSSTDLEVTAYIGYHARPSEHTGLVLRGGIAPLRDVTLQLDAALVLWF